MSSLKWLPVFVLFPASVCLPALGVSPEPDYPCIPPSRVYSLCSPFSFVRCFCSVSWSSFTFWIGHLLLFQWFCGLSFHFKFEVGFLPGCLNLVCCAFAACLRPENSKPYQNMSPKCNALSFSLLYILSYNITENGHKNTMSRPVYQMGQAEATGPQPLTSRGPKAPCV